MCVLPSSRGRGGGRNENQMAVSFKSYNLKIDETGHGQVRRGTQVAHAHWDGFDLVCPALPDAVRFELEVALLGGETRLEVAS